MTDDLRIRFAMHAPEPPVWFMPVPEPFPPVKGTFDDWTQAKDMAVAARYFAWRWFYADTMMCEADK